MSGCSARSPSVARGATLLQAGARTPRWSWTTGYIRHKLIYVYIFDIIHSFMDQDMEMETCKKHLDIEYLRSESEEVSLGPGGGV